MPPSRRQSKMPFAIIGHRGAAGLAPENTLASFATAIAYGCPMVELDVHKITDVGGQSQLAVIHDADLSRTTNGRGRVADLRVSDLAVIDAGEGERIPLLRDVIALMDAHAAETGKEIILNVELKGPGTGRVVAEYLATIDNPVLVSSFNHEELARFRSVDGLTPVAPLFDKWQTQWLEIAEALEASAVNLSSKIAWPKRLAAIREAGYDVFVYTVNSLRRARQLKKNGASGIFTDRPDKMVGLD